MDTSKDVDLIMSSIENALRLRFGCNISDLCALPEYSHLSDNVHGIVKALTEQKSNEEFDDGVEVLDD